MMIYTLKFDRKKTAFCVVVAALLLIGIILLVGAYDRGRSAQPDALTIRAAADRAKNEKGRVAYLAQYGWTVESPAESEDTVVIPRHFSDVFARYNDLQKQQGYDLSAYCGQEVTLYTYRVTNAEFPDDEVLASLYVLNGSVIGGDVHSTALDGFIRPLRAKAETV